MNIHFICNLNHVNVLGEIIATSILKSIRVQEKFLKVLKNKRTGNYGQDSNIEKFQKDLNTKIAPIGNVLYLKGEVGVGKTTLVRAIIEYFDLEQKVVINSPTFNIGHQYKIFDDISIWHFDLYRIKHEEELDELGILEILDNDICMIEWPEVVLNKIKAGSTVISIYFTNEINKRRITISK
ncbi:tRNA threonylcarbamoyladenosine biosynthesis protein TsaE [Alphaproteobacteria bacterium]